MMHQGRSPPRRCTKDSTPSWLLVIMESGEQGFEPMTKGMGAQYGIYNLLDHRAGDSLYDWGKFLVLCTRCAVLCALCVCPVLCRAHSVYALC